LRLTIVGKNANSLGYRTTVDNLTLTKTAAFFSDDFEDGNATGWTPGSGTWSVVTDGTFRYAQTSTAAVTNNNVPTMGTATDMTVSADVKLTALGAGTPAVSIAFRYVDANNFYTWQLRPGDNQLRFYKVVAGTATQVGTSVAFTPVLNTTYTLKVVASGSTLTGYVDGVQKLQVTDGTFTSGKIALRVSTAAVRFDNVVVTTP
jgi:pectate lyase